MEKLTLGKIAQWSQACLPERGSTETLIGGVSTDSRAIQEGDLFVALKGDQFNGHDFLDEVTRKGAVAAMVDAKEMSRRQSRVPLVLVDDTLIGLQSLAQNYRCMLNVKAVAIAGSNGKTGTKEMVSEVLHTQFSILKNQGNLNNHIGIPISLLQLDRIHQIGVFEVGTNHPGELLPLLRMVQPIAGVITTIGEEHLEFFHDLEGVAKEEGTVAEVLPEDGLLVLNADDEWSSSIARRSKTRVVHFGLKNQAEYQAHKIEVTTSGTRFRLMTPSGNREVLLQVIGRHQVANALAAAAVGEFFGLDLESIGRGLEAVTSTKMRMERHTTHDGILVVNDAYNANPSSMRAALDTMQELTVQGRKIAVLGEMLELGEVSASAHQAIGLKAAESGIDLLVAIGSAAKPVAESAKKAGKPKLRVEFFQNTQEATKFLKSFARAGDLMLLKGSRGARLERVLEDWK